MSKLYIWWYCEKDQWGEVVRHGTFNLVYAESLDEAEDLIEKEISDTYCSFASSFKSGKISIGIIETNVEANWLWNYNEEENE